MSINSIHNINIEKGIKTSELRTRPPKIDTPFKVYTYESGPLGRHRVVNEWICRTSFEWLMYMGIPAHLSSVACVSNDYIRAYSNSGNKNITELKISELKIYKKPISIYDFVKPSAKEFDEMMDDLCPYCIPTERGERATVGTPSGPISCEGAFCNEAYTTYLEENNLVITRAPQNWCYVKEMDTSAYM